MPVPNAHDWSPMDAAFNWKDTSYAASLSPGQGHTQKEGEKKPQIITQPTWVTRAWAWFSLLRPW